MFWDDPLFWVVLLCVATAFYLIGLMHRSNRPPED